MSQFQHTFVFMVVYIILWNLFIKQYFYDEEEYQGAMKFWHKIFKILR